MPVRLSVDERLAVDPATFSAHLAREHGPVTLLIVHRKAEALVPPDVVEGVEIDESDVPLSAAHLALEDLDPLLGVPQPLGQLLPFLQLPPEHGLDVFAPRAVHQLLP